MRALVTDAHLRSALAGLRGLGRAGVGVLAAAPTRVAPGLWSRYTSGRELVARDGAPLGPWLAALAERAGPFVVYPGQEHTIDALLAADGLPDGVVVPYPDAGALAVLRDKRALFELAADSGLGAPATLSEGTARELASSAPRLPFALKPARPGGALPTTRVVESPEQLHGLLAALPPDEPLLVQERASGPLVAIALVTDAEGGLLARFQQEAKRTWPPTAGNSSLAVSVAPDEELVRRAADTLTAAGYSGLAQLQFIQTAGGPQLIDVNPRFYGSLPLALACGVNLPAAWHASLARESTARPGDYRLGVTYRWLEGELMAAVHGSPGVMLRRGRRPRASAVWAGDDPVPGVVAAAAAFGTRLSNRLARRR